MLWMLVFLFVFFFYNLTFLKKETNYLFFHFIYQSQFPLPSLFPFPPSYPLALLREGKANSFGEGPGPRLIEVSIQRVWMVLFMGSQKASTSSKDKSWWNCQWPCSLPQPYNCQLHSEGLAELPKSSWRAGGVRIWARSSAQCSTAGLCLCFHQLLNESSMVTFKIFINLRTG